MSPRVPPPTSSRLRKTVSCALVRCVDDLGGCVTLVGVFVPLNSPQRGGCSCNRSPPPASRWTAPPYLQSIAYRHRDRLVGIIVIRGEGTAVHRRQRARGEKETERTSAAISFRSGPSRIIIRRDREPDAID